MLNVSNYTNIRGAVFWYNFPYVDQPQAKDRPVFVVAELDGGNFIACKISTTPMGRYDKYSIEIENDDFEIGNIPESNSKVCPTRVVGQFEFRRFKISSISHRWSVTPAFIAGVTFKD